MTPPAPWSTIYRAMKADWDESPEFGKRCAIAVFILMALFYAGMVFWR